MATVRIFDLGPGEEVRLHKRSAEVFEPQKLGKAVASQKPGRNSGVEFTDLKEGERFWAVSATGVREVVAKNLAASPKPVYEPSRNLAYEEAPPSHPREIVTGPRSTADRPGKTRTVMEEQKKTTKRTGAAKSSARSRTRKK